MRATETLDKHGAIVKAVEIILHIYYSEKSLEKRQMGCGQLEANMMCYDHHEHFTV